MDRDLFFTWCSQAAVATSKTLSRHVVSVCFSSSLTIFFCKMLVAILLGKHVGACFIFFL